MVNFPALSSGWLAMPSERSASFLPAFVRMSLAIQTVLRKHVPEAFFEDVGKYRDVKIAWPMLIYQASPPFQGKKRAELTYDVLNPALIAMLFRRTKPSLTELLVKVEKQLRAAGFPELADTYAPRRAGAILNSVHKLSKRGRYLYVLIRGESVLVDALLQLNGLGDLSLKGQAKKWAAFGKKWNFQLRRLFPGKDFTGLVPILLNATENALLYDPDPSPDGGLSLGGGTGESLQAIERICLEFR